MPDRSELEKRYEQLYPVCEAALLALSVKIRKSLEEIGIEPSIKSRVKSFPSWFRKRILLLKEARSSGKESVPQITDLMALRVICPFLGDLDKVEKEIKQRFKVVEVERKGAEHSFREFGYESTHILIELPKGIKLAHTDLDVDVCEIQVRTILQDAWAEVEHELVYKAEFNPFDDPMKRKLAALNANLTLSDIIFQELRDYQHRLSDELEKRRTHFFRKIENSIDDGFFHDNGSPVLLAASPPSISEYPDPESSIDELLLAALNAHNRNDYKIAIDIYTSILSRNPKDEIASLIYKHRGMAYFAESRYGEALKDFSLTLELDPGCYKAAYYRGVVNSVRMNYDLAVEDFTLALDIHPYHFYSLYRRCQAFYHQADYPRALGDCESALKLDPENEQAMKMKVIIHGKLRM